MGEKATAQAKQTVVSAGQATSSGFLQRKCACGTHTTSEQCDSCKSEGGLLQRKASSPTGHSRVPSIVHEVLRSPGQPLDAGTRAFFEPRFGHDFSHVRVHTDAMASASARAVAARAYTISHNIVLASGQYSPTTLAGKKLLAHELTHVAQQTEELQSSSIIDHPIILGSEDDRFEREADEVAEKMIRNETAPALQQTRSTQSQPAGQIVSLAQRKSDSRVLRRKCDVDPALSYYAKTPEGKKINFNEWLEKMRKVAGPANKSLYDNAKAEAKIGPSFVLLVCKIQDLLKMGEDGRIGDKTAAAFDKFATGGKKGIDYTRLFKDKKLEVGIAIGDQFKTEFTAIVTLLETEGKKLKNFSSTGSAGSKTIKFTKEFPVQGDKTAAPVPIDVEFSIVSAESATPKKSYSEFLSQKEIAIYSGHARMGTGPDFDPKASVKENFIIGVNSALHKAGKLTKGYDAHMNEVLEKQGNDLEAMSKAGKIDPDKYQVWFFNACSSIQYLDEIRGGLVTDKAGKTKSKANLRVVGTTASIWSDAVKIVDSILKMKTMDEIIDIMNLNEKAEVKAHGEKEKDSYYFSD